MAMKYGKEKRMRMFYREFLYSPFTGEEYSATKGDYFMSKPGHVFTDSEGSPMILMGDKGIGRNGQPTLVRIGSPVKVSDLRS